ncbi:MAG: hypothetical protein QXT57_00015 [Thermosphaera sp.]
MEVKKGYRSTHIDEFERRVERPKSLILSGKLDNVLGMKAKEEVMGHGKRLMNDVSTEPPSPPEHALELIEIGKVEEGGEGTTCPSSST